MNKRLILQLAIVSGAIISGILLGTRGKEKETGAEKIKISEISETENLEVTKTPTIFENKEILNILLLGIDRRSKSATTYNTDTMILLSVNKESNVVLLTSVPRDLWINGNKINALYSIQGEKVLVDAFEKITGLAIDGYISCDFEDFRWIVDSFGGVPVDIERTFADPTFPNNSDTGILRVTFEKGTEKMAGDRALTFARSRKGNNGEGSDLMRAKRQHKILIGMVNAISQPGSIFWPMDLPKFYEAVTQRMHTTLSLVDITYLWDFYKDRGDYEIISFVVDDKYVYHPGLYPQSTYKAWVFIPREASFETLHNDIQKMLSPETDVEATDDTSNQPID